MDRGWIRLLNPLAFGLWPLCLMAAGGWRQHEDTASWHLHLQLDEPPDEVPHTTLNLASLKALAGGAG